MQNPKNVPGQNGEVVPARPVEVVYRDSYQPDYTDDMQQSSLHEYWKTLSRHKAIVILAAFLGGVAGFLYTVPATPIFQASTTIEVQGLNANFLNMQDVNPNSGGGSFDPSYDILTQVGLLESGSLRERAVKKLKERKSTGVTYPTDRLSAWKKALGIGTVTVITPDEEIAEAAGSIQAKASGTTRIITVSCDSPDPKLAADFVNTLVNEFIQQDLEARLTTSAGTSEFLSRQLEELKIKLEKSEDQLQSYATSVGLQFTVGREDGKEGEKENIADEKLRQLQQELLKAKSERVAAQSKFELASSAPADSLPQVLDDESLRDYQNKLTDLRRQLAELSASLTPANPKVQKVQAQINELDSALKKERGNVVSRIRNEYQAADRRERLISAEYENQLTIVTDQAGKSIHYNILKREVDTNRQIYEAMLQKVKEAGIASAMRASGYRVVDPANPPAAPYKPNPSRTSVIGAFGGLLLGIAFAFARERADRSLQQPGDLAMYLNLPELGVIPSEKSASLKRLYGADAAVASNGNHGKDSNGLGLTVWKRKPSLLAESFQVTLTSILFSNHNGHPPQVLALSSAGPSEGKSTISSNLAVALAEINQRVLLIDGDLRRPRQHEIFALPNEFGLSNLLKEKQGIRSRPDVSILQPTEVPGLCLLSSGPPVANASNLLHSPRLGELLRVLRYEFDTILIDTPPMLHLADARVFGQHCDGVILVARAGKTTRDAALAARKKLQEDGTSILGTILNDWDPGSGNGYGYGGKYYAAYSAYYKKDS